MFAHLMQELEHGGTLEVHLFVAVRHVLHKQVARATSAPRRVHRQSCVYRSCSLAATCTKLPSTCLYHCLRQPRKFIGPRIGSQHTKGGFCPSGLITDDPRAWKIISDHIISCTVGLNV